MKHVASTWLVVVGALGLVTLTGTLGCSKDTASAAAEEPASGAVSAPEAAMDESAALVEQQGDLRLSWVVDPEGHVWLAARGADGARVEPAKGTLAVRPLGAAAPAAPAAEVALAPSPGAMRADVGPLRAELTELRYTVEVQGKPLTGVLHLPATGTRGLVAAAPAPVDGGVARDTTGPHGGVVQVVGDDVVEIVAHKTSGEVRVYVLDATLEPVAVGDRKVKLAFAGESSQYLELAPAPDGTYLTAKLAAKIEPVHLTVVVVRPGAVHVALCGHWRGDVIVVDHHRPHYALYVVDDWDLFVHGHGHGHGKWKGKGKGKGKWKGPGAHVDIHIH
ncbi:MAG: hypothetical protein IT373_28750 [Polyangiaceae bacterium]|nr:hypothetical protein [Polyangiaceae bacterium]